jgi:hypothetical protein
MEEAKKKAEEALKAKLTAEAREKLEKAIKEKEQEKKEQEAEQKEPIITQPTSEESTTTPSTVPSASRSTITTNVYGDIYDAGATITLTIKNANGSAVTNLTASDVSLKFENSEVFIPLSELSENLLDSFTHSGGGIYRFTLSSQYGFLASIENESLFREFPSYVEKISIKVKNVLIIEDMYIFFNEFDIPDAEKSSVVDFQDKGDNIIELILDIRNANGDVGEPVYGIVEDEIALKRSNGDSLDIIDESLYLESQNIAISYISVEDVETVEVYVRGINIGSIVVDTITNRVPTVVHPISDLETTVTSAVYINDISTVFTDRDGDNLTYSVSSSNESVATASIDGYQLAIVNSGNPGSSEITIFAEDGRGGSTSTTFNISYYLSLYSGVEYKTTNSIYLYWGFEEELGESLEITYNLYVDDILVEGEYINYYNIVGLEPDTSYNIRIEALNSINEIIAHVTFDETTEVVGDIVSFAGVSSYYSVDLSWDGFGYGYAYKLFIDGVEIEDLFNFDSDYVYDYTILGLDPDMSYQVKLEAWQSETIWAEETISVTTLMLLPL